MVRCRSRRRLTIWACTETSCAERGSSSTTSWLQRQRPRDADALALPAGELVRKAVGMVRRQPDEIEQARDLRPLRRPVERSVDAQRFADKLRYPHPGIQRGIGVLEHELHGRARRGALAAAPAR